MFGPKSRYAKQPTTTVTTARGETVTVVVLPVRARPPVRGAHPRVEGQRLDQIAAHYLGDAQATWRLCDAGNAVAPDALAARAHVAIPDEEKG